MADSQKPKVTKITFTTEWTAYRTGDGKWYFVAASTKQSQWTIPTGLIASGILDALTSNGDLDRTWHSQHLGGALPPPADAVARESQLKQRARALQSRYPSFHEVEVPQPLKDQTWIGPGTWTHAAGLENISSELNLLRAISVALAASYPSCFGGQAALEGQWQRLTLSSLNPDAILRPEVRQMLAAAPEEFLTSVPARQALAEVLSSSYSGHAGLVSILSGLWGIHLKTRASAAAATGPAAASKGAVKAAPAPPALPAAPSAAAPPKPALSKRKLASMIMDDEDEEEIMGTTAASSSSSSAAGGAEGAQSSASASSLALALESSHSAAEEGAGAQEVVLSKLVALFRQAYTHEIGVGLMALLPEHPLGDSDDGAVLPPMLQDEADSSSNVNSNSDGPNSFSWLSRVLVELMRHAQWRHCLVELSEADRDDLFLRRAVQLMARNGYHNDVVGTAAVAPSLATHVTVLREAIARAALPFNGGILELVSSSTTAAGESGSGSSSSSSSLEHRYSKEGKQHLHLHVARGVAKELSSSPALAARLLESVASRRNAWSNAWVLDAVPQGTHARRLAARRLASSEYGTVFSAYALQQAIAVTLPPSALVVRGDPSTSSNYLASRYNLLVSGVSTSAPRPKRRRLKLKIGGAAAAPTSNSGSVIDLTKSDGASADGTASSSSATTTITVSEMLATVAVPDNTRTAAAIRLGRFRQDVGVEALAKRNKAAATNAGASSSSSTSSATAAAAAAAASLAKYLSVSPLQQRLLTLAGGADADGSASSSSSAAVLQGLATIRSIALQYFSGLKGEFFPDEGWPFIAARGDEVFHPNLSMPASAPVQKAFGGTLITSSSSSSSSGDPSGSADVIAADGKSFMDVEDPSNNGAAGDDLEGNNGGVDSSATSGLLGGGKEGQQINSPAMVEKRKGAMLSPLVVSAADVRAFLTALSQVSSFLLEDETIRALVKVRRAAVTALHASAAQVYAATAAATTTASSFHALHDQLNAASAGADEAAVAGLSQQLASARASAEEAHAAALQAQAQHERCKADLETVDAALSQGSSVGQTFSQPDVIAFLVHLLFHPNVAFNTALCRGTPLMQAALANLQAERQQLQLSPDEPVHVHVSAESVTDADVSNTATQQIAQVLALALWNANTGALSNALLTAKRGNGAPGSASRSGSKLDTLVIGSYNRGAGGDLSTGGSGLLPALPGAQAVDLTSHCLPPALLFSRFGGDLPSTAAPSSDEQQREKEEEEVSARESAHIAALQSALIEASRAIKADTPSSLLYPLTSLINAAHVPAGFSIGGGGGGRPSLAGPSNAQSAASASIASQQQLAGLLFKSLAHPVIALGSLHAIRHALLQQTLGDDPRLIATLAMLHRYALAISDAWPLLSLQALGLLRQSLTVYPSVAAAAAVTQHREAALQSMGDLLLSGSGAVVMPILTYARLQAESAAWDISLLRFLNTHVLKGLAPQPVSAPFALEYVRLLHATQARIASKVMATAAVAGGKAAAGSNIAAVALTGLGSGIGPLGNLPNSVTVGGQTVQRELQRFLERTFKECSEANQLYHHEADERAALGPDNAADLDENEPEDAPLLPDKVSGASVEATVQARAEVIRLIGEMNEVFTRMGLL